MSHVLIDGIAAVSFANGLLRVDCVSANPKNEYVPSGTLLIPGNRAGEILTQLIKATQELDRRQKERNEEQAKPGSSALPQ